MQSTAVYYYIGGIPAYITPAVVAGTAAVPAPTVTATNSPTPDVVACVASVPTPTLGAGAGVGLTPSVVAGTASIPEPTLATLSAISTSTVAGVAAVGAPAVQAGQALHFTPPTVREKLRVRDPLFSRMYLDRGVTVLNEGGFFRQVSDPAPEVITAATAAYIGGHTYNVTVQQALLLLAAGYGSYLE